MTGKVAKTVKAVKAAKPVAKKPLKDAKTVKDAKAAKPVAKKPLKDAKTVKDAKPVAKAIAKAVVKKPLKYAKASKATKAVAKKPLKDVKDVKAVAKKPKKQISYGGLFGIFECVGLFCGNNKVLQPVAQQPVAQQPVEQQPDNLIKTSLGERNNNMILISNTYKVLENEKCNLRENPYDFQLKRKVDTKPIFATTILIDSKIYEIVIKIMEYNEGNLLEKNIMIAVRDYIISKNISKHFLLIYFYSLCPIKANELQLRIYNEPVENSLKNILLLEYDDSLILNDDTFYNLLVQSLISIGSYHNLTGYVHMDTHTGNFLCAKNSEHNRNGYYKYEIGDAIYYMKSCEYNVMIYDFGDSNKITIPVDKIKRFELFYEDDKEEDEEKFIVLKSFIVNNKAYYNPNTNYSSALKIYLNRDLNTLEKDYLNQITNKFINIDKNVNYYRMKILIDDYSVFLHELQNFNVNNHNRLPIILLLIESIEKIKNKYLRLPLDITDDLLYGYARDIFKNVLELCVKQFPYIFLKQDKIPRTVLNNEAFKLYQEDKIVVADII